MNGIFLGESLSFSVKKFFLKGRIQTEGSQKNDLTVFSYTRADWVSLSKHIEGKPFVPYCISNVDMMVSLWYERLYKCFQSHIPTKTRHRISFAPWVSNETSNLVKRKQTLQKALQTQANENRQRKLEALNGKILPALETDQLNFENTVSAGGKFSDVQWYFKSIKKTTQFLAEMFLENENATTDLKTAEFFTIFAQSVFTSTYYQNQPELTSPMKIEKMHFIQSEKNLLLGTSMLPKQNFPMG